MSVRPHPSKGPGWWYIDLGYDTSRRRIPFQGTKAEAEAFEQDLRRERNPIPVQANPRLGEIAPDYLTDYATGHQPSGSEKQRRALAKIGAFFGRHLLNNINGPLIEQYKRQRLADGVKPSTIQKELCALSGCLKWAEEQGMINAAPKIKRFSAAMTRAPIPQVPTAAEVQAILAHIPHHKRPIFALMYWCGLRAGEAREITGSQVAHGRHMLIIKGKGGKSRTVPVPCDELWTQIAIRVKELGAGYLFPNPETGAPYKDLRGTLAAAAKKAGYRGNITPHKFRHAYGTDLIATGAATLRDVQLLLGHSTSQITEIYTHLSTERLTAVTDRLKNR